ncbi:MFS transporter [Actinomadura algeriensis]|uniref:EmrB/QacA subfamily drug resistance transporter n=1 Tax=Actinomadura algeriensis TaxID=1679523 RepID=A0ABR9JR48_9ACTN|nr:MFS transporter [Actinomadura algeriensis]MBE1533048.1 EmrB/QacA subfamily drug resistance transporter [Actinomadura algeriensis]
MGRVVLVLACAAQFMVVLDVSVVNVALPAVQDDLGFAAADLPWVAGAYTLAFAGFLLLGGRLADIVGARRTFLAGLLLFCLPSLVGGLATAPGALIAARAAQGIGAAVLAPATLTIITTTIPEGTRRTRALAVWTAVGLVGGAAGNLVGGVLTEALSWRWILLVNVPVGLAAAVLARRVPDGRRDRARRRLDVPGAVAATAGLALLAFGIMRAGSRGWTDAGTAGALGGALVLLAALAVVEARAAADPLVPPRLLRSRAIGLGNVLMLLAGGCFQVPMWYFLTLYMQDVLGFSALETGLGFLPHTLLTMLVGLQVTPRLMRRVDDRALVAAGAAVAAAGFLWQGAVAGDGGGTYVRDVLGPAVLVSAGGGLLNTPLTTTVTAGVAAADAGAASGLLNTAKQVGGAVGLAALAAATGTYGAAFLAMAVMLGAVAAASLALPARRDAPPDVPRRTGQPSGGSRRY